MELKQKGAEASLGGLKQCLVSLKWTTAADFDLAAAYESRSGEKGMVYFGELGDLNAFPFMGLSGDEGVGDTGGDNEETLRVMRLDEMRFVWVICWDYGAVQKGEPARFEGSDASVSLMDDSGTHHEVKLVTGDIGNACVVATIDNSSPMGAKLVNSSRAATLKGLTTLDDLLAALVA